RHLQPGQLRCRPAQRHLRTLVIESAAESGLGLDCACDVCSDPGTFCNGTGMSSPGFPCGLGTYSNGGLSACALCPSATQGNDTQLTQCNPCEIGTYSPSAGLSACLLCG